MLASVTSVKQRRHISLGEFNACSQLWGLVNCPVGIWYIVYYKQHLDTGS